MKATTIRSIFDCAAYAGAQLAHRLNVRRLIPALTLACMLMPAHPAWAGGVVTGKVQVLYTINFANAQDQGANIALLKISGTVAGNPTCSAGGEWAFSLKDPSGRAMFAQLLHAQSSGLNVTVVGDGSCSTWFDRERPLYLYVVYP